MKNSKVGPGQYCSPRSASKEPHIYLIPSTRYDYRTCTIQSSFTVTVHFTSYRIYHYYHQVEDIGILPWFYRHSYQYGDHEFSIFFNSTFRSSTALHIIRHKNDFRIWDEYHRPRVPYRHGSTSDSI